MKTTKHPENKAVKLEPGMCIVDRKLPLGDGTYVNRPNFHPFVIVGEGVSRSGTEYVELVMGRTLFNDRENKDRSSKLERFSTALEITDPCPPMDTVERRRQYIDTAQTMVIPKSALYKSDTLEICATRGDKLSDEQMSEIKKAVHDSKFTRWAHKADPFHVQQIYYSTAEYSTHRQGLPPLDNAIDASYDSSFSM